MLITHEMAVIRQVCTRVAILDGGSIAEEGTVDDVFIHTRSVAGKRLFGILANEDEPEENADIPALRVIFDSADIGRPVISSLIRKFQIDVNILAADVKRVGGKQYGQMLIEAPADENLKRQIIDDLTRQGLKVKEVYPK